MSKKLGVRFDSKEHAELFMELSRKWGVKGLFRDPVTNIVTPDMNSVFGFTVYIEKYLPTIAELKGTYSDPNEQQVQG